MRRTCITFLMVSGFLGTAPAAAAGPDQTTVEQVVNRVEGHGRRSLQYTAVTTNGRILNKGFYRQSVLAGRTKLFSYEAVVKRALHQGLPGVDGFDFLRIIWSDFVDLRTPSVQLRPRYPPEPNLHDHILSISGRFLVERHSFTILDQGGDGIVERHDVLIGNPGRPQQMDVLELYQAVCNDILATFTTPCRVLTQEPWWGNPISYEGPRPK